MKRFEFRLQRVMELRQHQADLERSRLETLLAQMQQLDQRKDEFFSRLDDARAYVGGLSFTRGEDLNALGSFERHVEAQGLEIEKKKSELRPLLEKQRIVTAEAQRKVKLIERLRERRFAEWTRLRDKEIEDLAADSHMASRFAEQRQKNRREANGIGQAETRVANSRDA